MKRGKCTINLRQLEKSLNDLRSIRNEITQN